MKLQKKNRDIVKSFITAYIDSWKKIITKGWPGYLVLHNMINYEWESYNHGAGNFGFGLSSTSHIESLYHQLKSKIRDMYHSIPAYNFLHFLREAEWLIKNLNLS